METTIKNRFSSIRNKCKLCLYEKYKNIGDLDALSWDFVTRVVCSSNEAATCSICRRGPSLPRMTMCGHVCCLVCVQMRACAGMPCAVCGESLEIGERFIKRVTLVRTEGERGQPVVGDTIALDLLVSDKPHTQPRLASSLHRHRVTPIARSHSSLSNCTGIGIDSDTLVIASIKRDIGKLERKREKMRENDVIVSTEWRAVEEAIEGLKREMGRLEGCWWRESERREDNRLEEGQVFNLLRLDEMMDGRELFYCGRDHRAVYLVGDQRDAILALRDSQDNSPPISVKGRVLRVWETNGAGLTSAPFEGASVTLVELDVDKPDLKLTYADEKTMNRLRLHREMVYAERDRSERFKEHMAAIAIERMNISSNSDSSQRISEVINKMKPPAERMLTPRIPIIGLPLKMTPLRQQQQYCSRNSYPVVDQNLVFNTCMVGIDCVDPDDEYPHSEKCPFYSRIMIDEPLPSSVMDLE